MTDPAAAGAAALVGTAVGDAFGAFAEGAAPRSQAAARKAVQWLLGRSPLAYTDDTQLALLLLEHLAEHGTVDADALVELLLDRIEPWRGYGGGMLMLVDQWRRGIPWQEAATAVFADGSLGNGAAMRVAPLGAVFARDAATVTDLATRQARVTHAHPVGVDGALVQARAAALAAHRGRFGRDELATVAEGAATRELVEGLTDAVQLTVARDADRPDEVDDDVVRMAARRLGTEVVAHRSVPLALWIAAHARDAGEAVTLAIAAGGDVDTIGAMATAVRLVADGVDTLPEPWLAAVEDGPWLADRARELAAACAR